MPGLNRRAAPFGGQLFMAKKIMAKKNPTKKASAGRESGGNQVFFLAAPNATRVQLAGDFTGWEQKPIDLKRDMDGAWRVTVKLTPGHHFYRFLVDGQWQDDPECPLHLPNSFGSRDNVRMVA